MGLRNFFQKLFHLRASSEEKAITRVVERWDNENSSQDRDGYIAAAEAGFQCGLTFGQIVTIHGKEIAGSALAQKLLIKFRGVAQQEVVNHLVHGRSVVGIQNGIKTIISPDKDKTLPYQESEFKSDKSLTIARDKTDNTLAINRENMTEKFDLVLIGNLILDQVYTISNWPSEGTSNDFQNHLEPTVGGIGNVARSFQGRVFLEGLVGTDRAGQQIKSKLATLGHHCSYYCHSTEQPTSQALILANTESGERTSFVQWGAARLPFLPQYATSKWTHLAYLDTLPLFDLPRFKETSEVLSADLCLSDPTEEQVNIARAQFKHLDYLFISESEFLSYCLPDLDYSNEDIMSFVKKYQLKNLVFHQSDRTTLVTPTQVVEVTNPYPIQKKNVLGAGDAYAAGFIEYQTHNISNVAQAALAGHQKASAP